MDDSSWTDCDTTVSGVANETSLDSRLNEDKKITTMSADYSHHGHGQCSSTSLIKANESSENCATGERGVATTATNVNVAIQSKLLEQSNERNKEIDVTKLKSVYQLPLETRWQDDEVTLQTEDLNRMQGMIQRAHSTRKTANDKRSPTSFRSSSIPTSREKREENNCRTPNHRERRSSSIARTTGMSSSVIRAGGSSVSSSFTPSIRHTKSSLMRWKTARNIPTTNQSRPMFAVPGPASIRKFANLPTQVPVAVNSDTVLRNMRRKSQFN